VAEATVHRMPVEKVHFHEVGGVDAIVDICGTAAALEHLGVDTVFAAPPPLGRGLVQTEHGTMPVPAPATLELLRGVPVASAATEGELTTPTGAAILSTVAAGRVGALPAMTCAEVGYGSGRARWPDRPNILRAVTGELLAAPVGPVLVVEANLDDLSPELLAAATTALFEAGALDVYVTPVTMKKGRPGHLLTALCRATDREAVSRALLAETTTFGLRIHPVERVELARHLETVETPYGPVRLKVGRLGEEVLTRAPEYEDVRARAAEAGVPTRVVYLAALTARRGP